MTTCGSLSLAVPRQPRLDAPSTLHHVMVRGIERTALFRDDRDRTDFVARLATVVAAGAWTVYAWALLPNHAHLLVRTGGRPLARSMRSLLTGYAGAFNRRHHRVGHLFQNRYKSIVVEEEPYLLELVRYLHLNPLRAKLVPDLRALDRFPWTGHSALLGTVPRPWQETATILAQFGATRRRAVTAYRAFVAAGIAHGRRPELQGGGLLRSHGGWAAVTALRRGREAYQGDERILGSSDFVEGYRRAVAAAPPTSPPSRSPPSSPGSADTWASPRPRWPEVAERRPSPGPGPAWPISGWKSLAAPAGPSQPTSASTRAPSRRRPGGGPAPRRRGAASSRTVRRHRTQRVPPIQ